jgi:hypothetical protein
MEHVGELSRLNPAAGAPLSCLPRRRHVVEVGDMEVCEGCARWAPPCDGCPSFQPRPSPLAPNPPLTLSFGRLQFLAG